MPPSPRHLARCTFMRGGECDCEGVAAASDVWVAKTLRFIDQNARICIASGLPEDAADFEQAAALLRTLAARVGELERGAVENDAELDECLAHKEQLHARISALEEENGRLREALEAVELLSTNHGGWFEQDPFGQYCKLGRVATEALAARALSDGER